MNKIIKIGDKNLDQDQDRDKDKDKVLDKDNEKDQEISKKKNVDEDVSEAADSDISELRSQVEQLADVVHGSQFIDYLDFVQDTKRLVRMNFILGLVRGLGMAIGFTILGAIVFYILGQIVVWNLPIISDFIAQIVELVQSQTPQSP